MLRRLAFPLLGLAVLALAAAPAGAVPRALFDNFHAEQAGNADWVIDNDQPEPVPAQSAIGPATARTYWTGAISSWGVDLVKRGYSVKTNNAAFTYGNASNPLDLSNFDVLIVPEPNTAFTAAEITALFNFVRDGGGLIAVADHTGSDRNNDGIDSPAIWNAMDPTHLLGVHFGVAADANNNIVQTSTNVNTSLSDSIVRGPVGIATGLAFHNGTTMTLYPATNPTVRGEVWMTGTAQTSLTGVMAASSVYGNGRVFFVGDSSPIDDGSANAGNSSIFDGWGEAGATDSTLLMNATIWATRRTTTADVTPPVVNLASPNGGEDWKAGSVHAITWTATDDVAVTGVDLAWSADGGATFPNAIATNVANSGSWSWSVPDAPGANVKVRVIARDAAGNAGRDSSTAAFTISRWTITASAGTGGTITPAGAVGVAQGGSASFTIAPAAHHSIASVLVDGAPVGTPTGWTFSNVTANHVIAATFATDQFALTVTPVGVGTVAKSPEQATYAWGTTVQLTATPGGGWAFTGWSGDASGSTNPLDFVVNAASTVVATFADVQPPAVTVTAPVGGERWDLGSAHDVTWSATDNAAVDSVTVEWSAHGTDGPWSVLARGATNGGSLAWTLPAAATDSALVRVTAFDPAGHATSATSDSVFRIVDPNAGVEGGPAVLALARPAPNPARGSATLRFSLPAAGTVRLEVVDVSGRRVWAREGELGAGAHAWTWEGRETGAGLYFVRLVTPWGQRSERLARIR